MYNSLFSICSHVTSIVGPFLRLPKKKSDRLPYLLRNDDLVSIRELLLVLLLYDNHNLVISFRQLEALDLRWSKVMKAAAQ